MGFCLFNNAVVAVNEIRRRGLCQKVLIVDWDVHHGVISVLSICCLFHSHFFIFFATKSKQEMGLRISFMTMRMCCILALTDMTAASFIQEQVQ